MTAQLETPVPQVPARQVRSRPLRVALLTNENTPYRIPLYRELAATPNWDFHVFTCTDREFDRLWNIAEPTDFKTKQSYSIKYFRRQGFGDEHEYKVKKEVHLPIGVVPDILKFRPDVVLSNEFGMRTLLAALTAKFARHKLVVYNESTCHTESCIGWSQRWLRKILHSRPDAYICNGLQSREYLETLGVPRSNIFEVGQAVDLESFDHDAAAIERAAFRDRWGIRGTCFLFVGQLTKFKGTDKLVQVWRRLCESQSVDATLVLAGEGEDHESLQREVYTAGLTNVRFLGFVQRTELATVYAAADVFVFPTMRDCFSLAFAEAMGAGLPVIGSVYGGESELVEEHVNGWTCDPRNSDDLAEKLQIALQARDELAHMGKAAQRDVQKLGIVPVAARIRAAVEHVMQKDLR